MARPERTACAGAVAGGRKRPASIIKLDGEGRPHVLCDGCTEGRSFLCSPVCRPEELTEALLRQWVRAEKAVQRDARAAVARWESRLARSLEQGREARAALLGQPGLPYGQAFDAPEPGAQTE